jgi:hypothetical protein
MLRGDSEPDERDIRVFSCGRSTNVFDVDLACDHIVSEPDHNLGEQLEALSLFVRDQNPKVRGFERRHNRPLGVTSVDGLFRLR